MYEYMHIVASFTHSHSLRHNEACLRLSRVLLGTAVSPINTSCHAPLELRIAQHFETVNHV